MCWQIYQHPEVCDRITNDSWGALDLETRMSHVQLIVENPRNHLLLVRDEEQSGLIVGCFLCDQKEEGTFEVHTMLLPGCRGADAIVAGRLGIKHMMGLPGVQRLVSYCPQSHKEILFFALKCGFHRVGLAALTWIKNGVTYPLQTVELNQKDLPCR